MKKILLTIALMLSVGSISAQDFAFEFAKADGTIIPDGSVVTITKAEEADDGSGDIEMQSGIYAKNVDGDADQLVRIAYDVKTMDNGFMQICFPSACASINRVSSGSTQPGKMGNLHSIATEWFPTAFGKCTVKINLESVVKITTGYMVTDDGPGITLQFVYADPASVDAAVSVATPVAYYSLSGQRLPEKTRGLVLVRLSDGRVVKRVIR